jgi:hypothetical protein
MKKEENVSFCRLVGITEDKLIIVREVSLLTSSVLYEPGTIS